MASTRHRLLLLASAFCALAVGTAGCSDTPTGPLRDAHDGTRMSTCTLSGCTATVSPTEVVPKGDPICDISDCDLPLGEDDDDTGGGGTGGGGTPTTPPDTTQQDTTAEAPCNTEDPIVDSREVQAGFRDLWKASNYGPDVPQEQRLEQYAWIMETARGYRLESMGVAPQPCGTVSPVLLSKPAGAVAWVHTHPWGILEMQTTCGPDSSLYAGLPSIEDVDLSTQFGGLRGYILDPAGITQFSSNGGRATEARHARCGY